MSSYSAVRSDFTDNRSYGYSGDARRLTNELRHGRASSKITNATPTILANPASWGW